MIDNKTLGCIHLDAALPWLVHFKSKLAGISQGKRACWEACILGGRKISRSLGPAAEDTFNYWCPPFLFQESIARLYEIVQQLNTAC